MSSIAMFFIGFAAGIVAFIAASVVFAVVAKKRQEKKLFAVLQGVRCSNKQPKVVGFFKKGDLPLFDDGNEEGANE